MRAKKMVTGIIISLIVIAVLLAATDKLPRAQAEDKARDANADVMARLDDVLKAQQDVMKRLDDMKEELKIIKIRVTQMQ